MADPVLESIEPVAPKPGKFKIQHVNRFVIHGQNLSGRSVTNIQGKLKTGPTVYWSGIQTISSSNTEIVAVACPKPVNNGGPCVALQAAGEPGDPEKGEEPLTSDPGTITPTVTGGFSEQFDTQYQ